jgi:hypothetical protein
VFWLSTYFFVYLRLVAIFNQGSFISIQAGETAQKGPNTPAILSVVGSMTTAR